MNLVDVFLSLVLLVLLALAIRFLVRRRGSSCCKDCEGCRKSESCRRKK